VFDADNEAFAPSPVIARLAVVRGDPTSNGVNQDGVAHNEFSPPLKAGTPKKGKTLTKVKKNLCNSNCQYKCMCGMRINPSRSVVFIMEKCLRSIIFQLYTI